MLSLLSDGMNRSDTAKALGVAPASLDLAISKLKAQESSLLAYDKVHHLDLIGVKKKLVDGVTEEKIAEAPLASIASAYGVFAKMEQLVQGRPTEIHGLMGYLMHLEKEDIVAAESIIDVAPIGEGDAKEA
jgi:hypothetical protein